MKIHSSITAERVAEAVKRRRESLDIPGFCIACGAEAADLDTEQHPVRVLRPVSCEVCGKRSVYDAEQLEILIFGKRYDG